MDQFQDRADAQIWNAIEAKNLKQALKLVDKRLAKKHTPYHEVSNTLSIGSTQFFLSSIPSSFLTQYTRDPA